MTSRILVVCDRCGTEKEVPYLLPPLGWLTLTADDPAVMNQHLCPECASPRDIDDVEFDEDPYEEAAE